MERAAGYDFVRFREKKLKIPPSDKTLPIDVRKRAALKLWNLMADNGIDLSRISEFSTREKFTDYLEHQDSAVDFIYKACPKDSSGHPDIGGVLPPLDIYYPGPGAVIPRLDRVLDSRNPQPAAIAFCTNVLTQGRSYGGQALITQVDGPQYYNIGFEDDDVIPYEISSSLGPDYKDWYCDDGSEHEALVIGRRRNSDSGRCEYLIRNSWGPGCDSYSSDWTCEKKTGQVWIDADMLERTVGEIASIRGAISD